MCDITTPMSTFHIRLLVNISSISSLPFHHAKLLSEAGCIMWRGGKLARTQDELEGVIEERLGALRADGLLGVSGNADLERGCGLEDAALVPGLVRQVVRLAPSHVQHPALHVNRLHAEKQREHPTPDYTRTFGTVKPCIAELQRW